MRGIKVEDGCVPGRKRLLLGILLDISPVHSMRMYLTYYFPCLQQTTRKNSQGIPDPYGIHTRQFDARLELAPAIYRLTATPSPKQLTTLTAPK